MSSAKTKWVAFKTNAIVPGAVLGQEKDEKMQVGDPVRLPAAYADHVVHEGIAEPSSAQKKAAAKKADSADKVTAAQKTVNDLRAKLDAMDKDHADRPKMADELAAAEAELKKLEDAQ